MQVTLRTRATQHPQLHRTPKVADARQTTPAKQRPVPARMVENQQTSLQTSPGKMLKDKNLSEILPVRAPFLDRTNNEPEKDSQQPSADVSHMSPTKIITPRDGLLTPDRWAINRSPLADRMEVPSSFIMHSKRGLANILHFLYLFFLIKRFMLCMCLNF